MLRQGLTLSRHPWPCHLSQFQQQHPAVLGSLININLSSLLCGFVFPSSLFTPPLIWTLVPALWTHPDLPARTRNFGLLPESQRRVLPIRGHGSGDYSSEGVSTWVQSTLCPLFRHTHYSFLPEHSWPVLQLHWKSKGSTWSFMPEFFQQMFLRVFDATRMPAGRACCTINTLPMGVSI